MFKSVKYQLDLSKSQKDLLSKFFGHTRFVYNHMLERKISEYRNNKTQLGYFTLCKELTALKKNPEFSWLKEVANQSLQQSIRNMDAAFGEFFKNKRGFPKFKSKSSKQSCKFRQNIAVNFEEGKIRLSRIGWLRVYVDRMPEEGTIKSATVSKNTIGKYFISLEYHSTVPTPTQSISTNCVGIDVGLNHFATLSTGEKINNPRFLEKSEQRLKVLQRRYSKKQKGSKRRERAVGKYAKQHYKIACKRKDFLHKLTSRIIRENQSVIIEDLNIEGMKQNPIVSKSIGLVSWAEFFRQLKYKANWYGKSVIKIGRFEPSSKTCSNCDHKKESLSLFRRTFKCESCGYEIDRDLNAAINIKNFGLKQAGKAIPEEDMEVSTLVEPEKC